MGAFEQFKGGARRALELLRDAQGLVRSAREKYAQARAELGEAGRGVGDGRVRVSLGRLGQVDDALGKAEAASVGAGEEFGEYLVEVGAEAGAGAGTGTGAAVEPARATSAEPVPLKDFRPDRPHPEALHELKRVGWPRTEDGRVQARGFLYSADGRRMFPGPLKASERGPGSDIRDLKEPHRSDTRYTTRFHIEGHTAAHMRRSGVREAVLYISIPPCGRRDKDPYRCDTNIAKLLPEGSRMVVWVVRERGMPERIVYRGTGEALT